MSITKKFGVVIILLIAISGLRGGHWLGVSIFVGIAYLLMKKPSQPSNTHYTSTSEDDDSDPVDDLDTIDNHGVKGGVRYCPHENNLIYDPEYRE